MMRPLAMILCEFARFTLPKKRKAWGDVMKAETKYIGDDRAAVIYAVGCLFAGFKERAKDFRTCFFIGHWSVVAITVALALYHIHCAWRGMLVMWGKPDPLYEALLRGSSADRMVAAAYHDATPIIVSLIFGLGVMHLVAAYFFARLQLQNFVYAWIAALLVSVLAVVIQLSIIWNLNGLPAEFVALIIQLLAVPALLLWSNGRHRHSEQL